MKFNDIQKMAKGVGINTFQMKKKDMILAIQRVENNIECYGTPRVEYCEEYTCLWRDDCLSVNEKGKMDRV
ncbi:MAG: SAP domain-containing protein [Deltaproteobacteria bacterium]|nr:SAP domain-containing protein [Deltaproteobacteria bacterium]